jgi:NitT/TauT family transport system ATP-binding protein
VKVRIEGLSKSFSSGSGAVQAIDRLDLNVHHGEICTLLGPSGCGKSTVLRILAGLERPSDGRVSILEQRGRLPAATVFQGVSLFPWLTALENAAYPLWAAGEPRSVRRRTATAMLKRLGIDSFARAYPNQLSEGMRQRVAIARALVTEADVLLMDEPFSALDEPTRLLLQEELQELLSRSGQTVIFVTHSIDEAVLLGDRVVVLSARPARIVAEFVVPFPRPRRYAELRTDHRFNDLTVAVWDVLRSEVEHDGGRR